MSEADDARMIRIYAAENATQRGNTANAQAGSVASAMRCVAKGIMVSPIGEGTKRDAALKESLMSEDGIGERSILELLDGVPGIGKKVVEQ